MPSLTQATTMADSVNQARNIPPEYLHKMLTKPQLLHQYETNKTRLKMPQKEALTQALQRIYVGAWTEDHAGPEMYAYLSTDENIALVEACLAGDGSAMKTEDEKVPSFSELQSRLKALDDPALTNLLMLEQKGHNAEKEARPHVVKMLFSEIQRRMAKAGPRPKASAEERAELLGE